MSATSSNKSKIVLFLMVVISLAFLITSFLAAALSNDSSLASRGVQSQGGVAPAGQSPQPSSSPLQASDPATSYSGIHGDCFIFRTPDSKIFGECSRP